MKGMNLRRAAVVAAAAIAAGLLFGGASGAGVAATQARAAATQPSFLHILTDDQTIDSLETMARTERLLVDRGTRFTDYNDVQPLCCPSRASFLTGQYPHNHGVLNNLYPYGYAAMNFSRTIYTALDDAGYRTGWIGKVLNAEGDDGIEPAPGFDDWLVPLHAEEGADMFDYELSDNGEIRTYTDAYQNSVYADRAREFIAAAGDEPFMLTLSVHSPHWSPCPDNIRDRCPPQPAPRDVGTYAGAKYPFGPDFDGNAAHTAHREPLLAERARITAVRRPDRRVPDRAAPPQRAPRRHLRDLPVR